jgi:hypothetical protein
LMNSNIYKTESANICPQVCWHRVMTTMDASAAIHHLWSEWDVKELDTLHHETYAPISNNPDPQHQNSDERFLARQRRRR